MSKEKVSRFSVSLPKSLLQKFDRAIKKKGYDNRSLAVADMARNLLVEHGQKDEDAECVGTVTLVYDHHKPHLQEALTTLQHRHREQIVSALHVHLDHHHCLEVLVVRGKTADIRTLADHLIGAKGVKHGKLSVTGTGQDLPS